MLNTDGTPKPVPEGRIRKLELTVPDDRMLWFVSDTHFGHRKLVTGNPEHFEQCRKYVTTEEMDDDIVRQWSRMVGDGDYVMHLGDIQMGTPWKIMGDTVEARLNSLPGNKVLFRGNHDDALVGDPRFTLYHYGLIRWRGRVYMCQHYPFAGDQPGAFIQFFLREHKSLDPAKTVLVHGHTHYTAKYSSTNRKDFRLQNNVGWEVRYAPMAADSLTEANRTYVGDCLGHQVVGLV